MARALAILTVLTALFACSGQDAPIGDVVAWAEDGEMYVRGVPLEEVLAADREEQLVDKELRHRNGTGWGSQGAYWSCGNVTKDGCTNMPPDLSYWYHVGNGPDQAAAREGVYLGFLELVINVNYQGGAAGVTQTASVGQADIYYSVLPQSGVDFRIQCVTQTNRTAAGATFTTCDKWLMEFKGRKSSETVAQYQKRVIRSGIISAGYAAGLKPTACGGAMAMSIYGTGPEALFCQQQFDLLLGYRAWYAAGAYSYNASAPAGL